MFFFALLRLGVKPTARSAFGKTNISRQDAKAQSKRGIMDVLQVISPMPLICRPRRGLCRRGTGNSIV